jgi:glutaredoxin 3
VQLDKESEGSAIQDILLSITGGRSVPRVFINGKFIGGGDETAAAAANGTLAQLLAA